MALPVPNKAPRDALTLADIIRFAQEHRLDPETLEIHIEIPYRSGGACIDHVVQNKDLGMMFDMDNRTRRLAFVPDHDVVRPQPRRDPIKEA